MPQEKKKEGNLFKVEKQENETELRYVSLFYERVTNQMLKRSPLCYGRAL